MTLSLPLRARRGAPVLLALLAIACGTAEKKSAGSPAVPVTVSSARTADFPIELRAIGTVESPWTVDIRPQVEGAIEKVHFQEGQDVAQGDVLFTIDRRPYEAALAAAEATLAKDRVQAANAEAEQKRAADLFAQGVISIDANDKVAANARALSAGLKADEAAVQNAKLRLDYCTIRSPLAGRTGAVMVKAGNLVRALDTTALVVIHQVTPIDVVFSVPEARLAEIRGAGRLDVVVRRRGEAGDGVRGTLDFIDHEVDHATGNVKLKARFANAGRDLWPGQFVDTTMVLSVRKSAVVVPSPAVQDGQKGPFVFVVKADKTAEVRPVTVGPSRDGETLVETGLAAGEAVVVDGQVRLTVGATVDAKPAGPAS